MLKNTLKICLGCLIVLVLVLSACSTPAPAPSTTPTAPTAGGLTASQTAAPAASPSSVPKASATAQKNRKLKFAYNQAPTSPFQKAGHTPWADDIAKATGGRVTIDMYPSDTLIKTTAVLEATKSGICDLAFVSTGNYPGQFEVSDSIALPFVSPSGEIGSRIAWALYQKYPEIQAQFKDYQLITIYTGEPYYIVANKKFYKTLDDFKGAKFRVQSGPPTDMMKLLGGTPVFIPIPDAYLNLQKGVVDGTTVPSEAVIGFRLYEVAPYFTYVPTTTSTFLTIMNKDTWNDLPKDMQDAIMSVSGEKLALRYGKDVFDGSRKDLPDVIKASGSKINEYTLPADEMARWAAVAGKPVWDDWVKKQVGRGIKNAQQILDDTLSLVKQNTK